VRVVHGVPNSVRALDVAVVVSAVARSSGVDKDGVEAIVEVAVILVLAHEWVE
jgi:hypothetical protein